MTNQATGFQVAGFQIALLAFDEMEALDFAGPFEVLTTASRVHAKSGHAAKDAPPLFQVRCVARRAAPVQARAGLRVVPDADFSQPMQADVLLIPGGVVYAAMRCAETLAWVRQMHARSRWTASVCTGAFVLAAAEVLSDEAVTTHHEDQADLQKQFPRLQVRSGVRWVEAAQGRIITSAGISAGMDMSLHLVAVMATSVGLDGAALAERTAQQMEYRWMQDC